jgi:hypothetical protein
MKPMISVIQKFDSRKELELYRLHVIGNSSNIYLCEDAFKEPARKNSWAMGLVSLSILTFSQGIT